MYSRFMSECSIEDCGKPCESRGYCNMHYTRWLRHGDPNTVLRERNRNGIAPCSQDGCDKISRTAGLCVKHYKQEMYAKRGECSVEGCSVTWSAQGLCHKHYIRLRSWGTTDDPPPTTLRGSCSVAGCDNPVKARDLCGMHLRRWYKWGSTELPERTNFRTCNRCKQKLPRKDFAATTNICLECQPFYRQERAAERLSRTSGVVVRAEELRLAQDSCCAICNIHESEAPKKRLHVDHDHTTGKVRALLCGNCNVGLGHFKENINFLEAAIRYLRHHQTGNPGPPASGLPSGA